MRAIETANPDKLYGIFGDAQWTNKDRLSDAMLRDLIEHFSSLELTVANLPEDELGQGYEYLIKKFADDSGHTAAEFYTNRTVVHLMTEMLEPQPGESHLRPHVRVRRHVALLHRPPAPAGQGMAQCAPLRAGAQPDDLLHRPDELLPPRHRGLPHRARRHPRRAEVRARRPPPALRRSAGQSAVLHQAVGPRRVRRRPLGAQSLRHPPQGRADYAFWQHILCSLAPKTGPLRHPLPARRALPPGGGRDAAQAHREPTSSNASSASDRTSSTTRRWKPASSSAARPSPRRGKGRILFINAVNEVTRERAQSFLTDEHIERIVKAYERFKDEPGFARVATLEEIRAKEGNLSIPLYVAAKGNEARERVRNTGSRRCPQLWRRGWRVRGRCAGRFRACLRPLLTSLVEGERACYLS